MCYKIDMLHCALCNGAMAHCARAFAVYAASISLGIFALLVHAADFSSYGMLANTAPSTYLSLLSDDLTVYILLSVQFIV